ncbi:serine/threonine protein kinase [Ancylothrix sp. C2]|uniref:serine/threonine-protein kinase n=1 Tax=Ancylothrix sp. D3o TaxID=2953691 RepID=UPI0021BA7859|nr:serine/threonine-protein kinase [Ancylothrix sp. D3o]MCT7950863.1 serine/threonine protein kinase [Ancylothrix sp. D3o]
MSYCLNPNCVNPQNTDATMFCVSCGSKLLLKERYRALRILGEGGFGRTFLGVDEDRLNSPCAIKQFLPHFSEISALQKATELFSREAKRLFELGEHPQIPDLFAYFEQDKRLYLVQEFIDGQNLLQELQKQGAFTEEKVRNVLNGLLPIFQFIHERNVVHRDIKPENILRRIIPQNSVQNLSYTPALSKGIGGDLVLVDFGVASQGVGTDLGSSGTRAGTQGFAPIEQLRGGLAYPASDIYSLGVTCITVLTAKMPDDLYDPVEGNWIWREVLAKQGKVVSPILGQILDKMLQDAAKDRYQSAAEVLQVLNAGENNKPTVVMASVNQTPPAPPPPPPVKLIDPILAAEFESIKTQFSQVNPPAKPTPPQPKPATNYDPSADLDSLKTEFGKGD